MKRFNKILLWLGRIVSLPLAGGCFYIVWTETQEALKGSGDGFVFLVFLASGSFCLAYFIVLWTVKVENNSDDKVNIVRRGGNKFKY